MNAFLFELKANRRLTFVWTVSIILVMAFFLSLFPSFAENAMELKKVLVSFPEQLRRIVGISIDTIATLPGFYSYVFLYVSLGAAIQAMILGTHIVAKETNDKTMDFLLTKPTSRSAILTAKGLAAITCLLVSHVFYQLAFQVIGKLVSNEPTATKPLLLISLSLLLIQLIFLALGFTLASVVGKVKSVIATSVATVFCFFVISALAELSEKDYARYLSPFQYFKPAYITEHNTFDPTFLIAEALIILTLVTFAFLRYTRRDMPS